MEAGFVISRSQRRQNRLSRTTALPRMRIAREVRAITSPSSSRLTSSWRSMNHWGIRIRTFCAVAVVNVTPSSPSMDGLLLFPVTNERDKLRLCPRVGAEIVHDLLGDVARDERRQMVQDVLNRDAAGLGDALDFVTGDRDSELPVDALHVSGKAPHDASPIARGCGRPVRRV